MLFPCRQLVIMHCLCSVTHFPKLCQVSFGKHRAVSGISVWSPCCSAGFYPELILKAFMSFKRRKVLYWVIATIEQMHTLHKRTVFYLFWPNGIPCSWGNKAGKRGRNWAPLRALPGEVWILVPGGHAARTPGFSSDSGHLLTNLLTHSWKRRHRWSIRWGS